MRLQTETRTARLLLRRPRESDLDAVFAIHSDPETNRFNPAGPMATRKQAEASLQGFLTHWREEGFGYWAVEGLAEPGYVIGFGGMVRKTLPDRQTLNLYFRFRPQAWGKGYASELTAAALDLAFGSLGESEVVGIVRPNNAPSIRALERGGLSFVGEIEDLTGHEPSLIYAVRASAAKHHGDI
jgi:RimJ/RimL family protein N-acetyltransferase